MFYRLNEESSLFISIFKNRQNFTLNPVRLIIKTSEEWFTMIRDKQYVIHHACKRFSIKWWNKKVINFETIKDIVLNNRNRQIEADQLYFSRNKKNWTVQSDIIKKIYSFVYDKRFVLEDLTTLPFGYDNDNILVESFNI